MKALELGERLQLSEGNFGNYKGYDLLISEYTQNFLTCPIITFRFEKTIDKRKLPLIKQACKKFGVIQLDQSGYGLSIMCNYLYGKYSSEKLDVAVEKINGIIDVLIENNLETLHSCVVCRQDKEEELENHIVNDRLILCHGSCFEEYKNYHLSKIKANEGNVKNYPKSIIYATLMGFVGYLPFFLLMLFSGYMLGILFMLIPVLAFWGYKKGNAPLNKKATVIIVIISAIVMFLGVYGFINLAYQGTKLLAQETGEAVVPFNEFIALCAGDIVYCVIFGVLGIVWSFKTITKDNNENKLRKLR